MRARKWHVAKIEFPGWYNEPSMLYDDARVLQITASKCGFETTEVLLHFRTGDRKAPLTSLVRCNENYYIFEVSRASLSRFYGQNASLWRIEPPTSLPASLDVLRADRKLGTYAIRSPAQARRVTDDISESSLLDTYQLPPCIQYYNNSVPETGPSLFMCQPLNIMQELQSPLPAILPRGWSINVTRNRPFQERFTSSDYRLSKAVFILAHEDNENFLIESEGIFYLWNGAGLFLDRIIGPNAFEDVLQALNQPQKLVIATIRRNFHPKLALQLGLDNTRLHVPRDWLDRWPSVQERLEDFPTDRPGLAAPLPILMDRTMKVFLLRCSSRFLLWEHNPRWDPRIGITLNHNLLYQFEEDASIEAILNGLDGCRDFVRSSFSGNTFEIAIHSCQHQGLQPTNIWGPELILPERLATGVQIPW